MKAKTIRTKEKKKNNIVIIINGEDAKEIKEKLLLEVKKLARKKELGYYIALKEAVSLETIQKFCDFSLQISVIHNEALQRSDRDRA